MRPYQVNICVYADSEEEVLALQEELNTFVMNKYKQGIYPRARALSRLLKQYGNSVFVNAFLKQ